MRWILLGVVVVVLVIVHLFRGLLRLKSIKLLPLEVPIDDALLLYGKPEETEPVDDWPDARRLKFSVKLFEVSVTEWEGRAHVVVYHFPARIKDDDHAEILRFYSDGKKWLTLGEGYSYRREDGLRTSWCSAMPVVGVGTDTYMKRHSKENGDPASSEGASSD